MTDLAPLLAAFKVASGCEATVWRKRGDAVVLDYSTNNDKGPTLLPSVAEGRVWLADRASVIAAIPGPTAAWLKVGPARNGRDVETQLDFLLPVLERLMQSGLEVEHAAAELAERYEEINLLYTISEILGRTVDLSDATNRILAEVSDTVGARKGSVQVYDTATHSLITVAVLGAPAGSVARIWADDDQCVSAKVYRARHAMIVADNEMLADAEKPFRRGAMLSVPILWTTPRAEPEPLGVVNLSDRRTGQPFTAGDQKLMSAIATQIGTAIQNSRLVTASLTQQRLVQEMQLAHELQMHLLPETSTVAGNAVVGARVVPAESVGGDLYNLFRLGPGKSGVMVGDVSGHGYRAALVMALTMSASAIHAQATTDPGDMLNSLLHSLRDDLADAEMFVSMFYGVVDRNAKVLRYANAGHPHAFVVGNDGSAERLPAMDPPLGIGLGSPQTASRAWNDDDLIVLFTDGVSDARDPSGARLGEDRLLELVKEVRRDTPERIVDQVFDLVNQHAADTSLRDDLTVVVLKT